MGCQGGDGSADRHDHPPRETRPEGRQPSLPTAEQRTTAPTRPPCPLCVTQSGLQPLACLFCPTPALPSAPRRSQRRALAACLSRMGLGANGYGPLAYGRLVRPMVRGPEKMNTPSSVYTEKGVLRMV